MLHDDHERGRYGWVSSDDKNRRCLSWPVSADYDIVKRSAEPTGGWCEVLEAGRFVQTVPSPTGRQQ
jgi:hypothetical protein